MRSLSAYLAASAGRTMCHGAGMVTLWNCRDCCGAARAALRRSGYRRDGATRTRTLTLGFGRLPGHHAYTGHVGLQLQRQLGIAAMNA